MSKLNPFSSKSVLAPIVQPVLKPIVGAVKDVGSVVNDARKDATKAGLVGVADVLKPLGPLGVPLAAAALTATGVGAPLAAALVAGANTAGRALDAGAGLTDAGKVGLTSGAISGAASFGGQSLGKFLDPYVQSGLKGLLSPELLTKYATTPLTAGTIQGGLGSLLGTQSFGSGFLQGASGSALSTGLNDLVNFGVNQFRAPAELQTLGQRPVRVGLNSRLAGVPNPAEGFDVNNVNFGLVGGKPITPGLGVGINFAVDPTLASLGLSKLSGMPDGGRFVNQPGSVTPRQTNIVSKDATDSVLDVIKAALAGGTGGAVVPALLGGAAGAGLAGLAGDGGGAAGATPRAPTVPGNLNIGRINPAYVPQQDTSYSGMMSAPSTYTGLAAMPLAAMAMPEYFGV